MYCFSITSRPAATIVRESSSERGANPCGSGFGMTTISGATAPSWERSQSAMLGVSSATTSARGALTSSGSIPEVRCEDDRCSWWTTTTESGASSSAQASSAGVTVTSTSVARPRSPCSSPASVSAENCLSHRCGTSRDSRACSSSSYVTVRSTRWSTFTRSSMAKAGSSAALTTLRIRTSWPAATSALAWVIADRSVPPSLCADWVRKVTFTPELPLSWPASSGSIERSASSPSGFHRSRARAWSRAGSYSSGSSTAWWGSARSLPRRRIRTHAASVPTASRSMPK